MHAIIVRHLTLLACAIALLLTTSGCNPLPDDAKAVRTKAEYAKSQLAIALESGRDVSVIVPKLKRVEQLGRMARFDEANRLLDESIAELEALNWVPESPESADETKQIFVRPRSVEIEGYGGSAMEAFLSHDGKLLFFNSDKFDTPATSKNIFYARRIDDTHFKFIGKVEEVNSDKVDGVPSMDGHGNFYFVSMAGYKRENRLATVYSGRFKNGKVTGIRLHPELSLNTPGWVNMDVEISKDGKTLYATQTYFEPGKHAFPTRSDFFVAHLINGGANGEFVVDERSNEIFRNINTEALEYGASISADELEIFFTRLEQRNGFHFTSYRASRKSRDAPFSAPEMITAITGFAEAPAITDDGRLLYYHKKRGSRFVIEVLERKSKRN